MRSAKVHMYDVAAGTLWQDEEGYHFLYLPLYLKMEGALTISVTLPFREAQYDSSTLFPFFDGLIPEGWLLDIAVNTWKLNLHDRMGLLLACCKDCIGAVSIHPPLKNEEDI